ncbi:MAG TPA: transketolase C-terminal domain-containing protein [Solirubrobacteraceae bacterium]|nr:transketolase C-terminal domain-containing protein [Solirubrobacteraceae bacterium]
MPSQMEGSLAVARTVARCRPEVVCAYPITPQTHIVEGLSRMVASGELAPCEFVNVESEFAAMSVAIGASATGARAYTATASQGLLYMAEALFNAAGLGLPIVMTVANRAIGAPINIWNDHSDAMALRDCGWVQLYATDNQEAADMHVQAFRLAQELSLPVMVCMDGFVLTHAFEPLEVPAQGDVDSYLPPFAPRQALDPRDPVTIGAMVGPEAFTEVRYLAHAKQLEALDALPALAAEFERGFGRASGGLLGSYRCERARTVIVALGSVLGTLEEVVDELQADGRAVGALAVKSFRPFPLAELRRALSEAAHVIVLERAFAVGVGGIVSADVHAALAGLNIPIHTVIAGLGGRAITRRSLRTMLDDAHAGRLGQPQFLDLNTELVGRELARAREGGTEGARRPGPHAENILRDLGIVAAGPV